MHSRECDLRHGPAGVHTPPMGIQFARARYISRSSGGSAVRSAAYNARDAITAARTGELFYFKHRNAPEHHAVLLPDGAAAKFSDSAVLWNAAEAAEKRKDAQVAREIVLALPADAALTSEDRIDLAKSFAAQHFVAKGLAVQLDVHGPHEGELESERANWHAHLLITTRRIEGDAFSARKARDLDPEVRQAGGRAVVADAEAWGALWRDHQNRFFQAHGLNIRVDPTATHVGQHIGPVRMRKADTGIAERADLLRQANEAAARDPDQVLATLTRNNATFSERDLDRHLGKHISDDGERAATKAAVLGHAETLPLYDRASGEAAERYTTKTVHAQERTALADAKATAQARHHRAVPIAAIEIAASSRSLRPDQRQAFDHAVAAGGLKIIEGRAGTGKSYSLAAIRDAHEQAGRHVIGLAPTNAVAQDLKADGFANAGTAHAELFRLKNGRTRWDRGTVVVVDEAAMLDSKVTGELFAEARRAGAKVILAGDDRQLASIERGGLFTELRQRHGAAEITEVTRQRTDWQRQAARDLAEGRFADAVAAFDRAGAITWTNDHVDARVALVAAWKRDTAADPAATRFVFAYTNRDVDALNAELRQLRRDRGELDGPDIRFETKHGAADFAIGDRVQFTDTDKRLHLYNGNAGTITAINARTGQLTATLDGGRAVSWSGEEFQGFRHGYAGTIYKGQGKTLDHTYLYHTHHWRAAASYVALTRQREISTGVRGAGNRARCRAARLADGARRDEGRLRRLGHAGGADARAADAGAAGRTGGRRRPPVHAARRVTTGMGPGRGVLAQRRRGSTPGCAQLPAGQGVRHPGGAADAGGPGGADGWLAGPAVFRGGWARQSRPRAGPGQRCRRRRKGPDRAAGAGGPGAVPARHLPRSGCRQGAARRDGEESGLDQHGGPHRPRSGAARAAARQDRVFRRGAGEGGSCGGRAGRLGDCACLGPHRHGGKPGGANVSHRRG